MGAAASGRENCELFHTTVQKVEELLGVRLSPAEVKERKKQVLAVLVHELLHAAIAKALPELSSPEKFEVDVANELLVRILEDELVQRLGLPGHTPEEHVQELSRLFPDFSLSVSEFLELKKLWHMRFEKNRDFRAFGQHLLSFVAARSSQRNRGDSSA